MNENNEFKKNTFLLTIGTFLNKGFQFVVIPIYSRWLSSAEYGQFDLLCTYISLLVPIITLSIHEAVFRFSVDEQDRKEIISNTTNGFVVNIVNLSFFFLILYVLFLKKLDRKLYISFLVYLLAELLAVYFQSYLRSIKRLDIYSFSMFFGTVFTGLFVTAFVFCFEWGLFGIVLGYGLGTLFADLVVCIWCRWFYMLDFRLCSLHKIKVMLEYSLPLIPNNVSWWVMNASDRQIINCFFGNDANGVYAIAHKIPALCLMIVDIFRISWQQQIIEKLYLQDKDSYINGMFEKVMTLLFTSSALLLAGSFILYYYIFDFKYFEAAKYSPVLILSVIPMAISQFVGAIQIAVKRPKQNGLSTVLGSVSNIILHFLLIDVVGLYAACISTLLANLFIAILRIRFISDIYTVKIDGKVVASVGGCFYFFVMSYFILYMKLNIINLTLAVVFFAIMNKGMIGEFVRNGKGTKQQVNRN